MTNTTAPSGCPAGDTSYDENPGYDFLAPSGTPVYAAAAGTVVNNNGQMCILTNISGLCTDWGYIAIDHGNGYITQYGNLSSSAMSPGQVVSQHQQIGLSGNKAPISLTARLHFEVLKLIPGLLKDYSHPLNFAVVDPYGWVGAGVDPLYSFGLGIPPARLWQP